jgi:hypothetical protein
MTTLPEHMRSLIALLEAQKPTRQALIARRINANLRTNRIDLGPNFSRMDATVEVYADGTLMDRYINLRWDGTGDLNKWAIHIYIKNEWPSRAQIALVPTATAFAANTDDDLAIETEYERVWDHATPTEHDKIAMAICGNVGIVPGSIGRESGLQDGETDYHFRWCRIVPGSTVANMIQLMPETEEQAEELERIFNQGKHPT